MSFQTASEPIKQNPSRQKGGPARIEKIVEPRKIPEPTPAEALAQQACEQLNTIRGMVSILIDRVKGQGQEKDDDPPTPHGILEPLNTIVLRQSEVIRRLDELHEALFGPVHRGKGL